MNYIVCVKQVPATTEVKINRENNTIVREGIDSIINPFDTYAVEESIRLRERFGGNITALSMGIPSVESMLRDTVALGVDEAILLSDRAFAGSDSLATSYALSMAIKKIGLYDLIICGKQASDGDTAQVGPELAEKLGIPHTTYVRKIEDISDGYIRCQRMTDDGYETIEMKLPALITVVKEINEPRLPSLKGLMRSKKYQVKILGADDIGADKSRCGLNGSPTQVIKTYVPVHENASEILRGTSEEQVNTLVEKLSDMQFLKCK